MPLMAWWQFGQAERGRIKMFAAFDRAHTRSANRLRRRKIRFADFHMDYAASAGFELACARQQLHDVKRRDFANTVRERQMRHIHDL